MKKCPLCGEISKYDEFCSNCGGPLVGAEPLSDHGTHDVKRYESLIASETENNTRQNDSSKVTKRRKNKTERSRSRRKRWIFLIGALILLWSFLIGVIMSQIQGVMFESSNVSRSANIDINEKVGSSSSQTTEIMEEEEKGIYILRIGDGPTVEVTVSGKYECTNEREDFIILQDQDNFLGFNIGISLMEAYGEDIPWIEETYDYYSDQTKFEKRGLYTDNVEELTVWTMEMSYCISPDDENPFYTINCTSGAIVTEGVSVILNIDKYYQEPIKEEFYEQAHKKALDIIGSLEVIG